MDCLFCKIATGDIPATLLFEDDDVVAFNDINPATPQHILIIPKKHIATMNDATETDQAVLGKMMIVAATLAKQNNVAEDGYRLVMNTNSHGGQSVYHIHLHLLAGRPLQWPPG